MKSQLPKRVLLTFVGNRDPYPKEPKTKEYANEPGPILTLIKNRQFDHVYLVYTRTPQDKETEMEKRAKDIEKALKKVHSSLGFTCYPLVITDPLSHEQLLKGLRKLIEEVHKQFKNDEDFYISVSSGTPTMHACWFLLASSKEIQADILYVREKRFVSDKLPLVNEVRLNSPFFPEILPRTTTIEVPDVSESEIRKAIDVAEIIGDGKKLKSALEKAAIFGRTDSTVLITGESGSGKELFARFIHQISKRVSSQFLPVNCASIPEPLFESELFGYKKGGFTGAAEDKPGQFVLANGGTLFLDEIAEMPLLLQAKLLRVIETNEIFPLGARKSEKVDVRIITATNQILAQAVKEKRFRADLYYRLNVLFLEIPPLRERKTDIPKLALHFVSKFNKKYNRDKFLSKEAESKLINHPWPGNIRSLKNTIERAVVLSKGKTIEASDISLEDFKSLGGGYDIFPELSEGFSIYEYEKQLYRKAYEQARGNQSKAAKLLGVSTQAFSQYFKRNLNKD